jgi:alpha-1,2-mannosyltransferase
LADILDKNKTWLKWALAFFILEIILVFVFNFRSEFSRTVFGNYYYAAIKWIDGQSLYAGETGGGFIYLLQSAILFVPFTLLPFKISLLFWFVLNICLIWLGVYLVLTQIKLSKDDLNKDFSINFYFFWMLILTLILGFSALRNGQATVMCLNLTLFSIYCLQKKKYGWTSVWLNLGLAFKPTMLIFYLLVLGCCPKIWWRLLLGLVVVAFVPFLIQSPEYVMQQYLDYYKQFIMVMDVGADTANWASLFSALEVFHLKLSHLAINLVIVIIALLTYGYALFLYRKHDFKAWVWSLACMATIYLLLFNPRTENNGYILLAPFLGYLIANAWSYKRFWLVTSLFIMGLLIALNYDISRNLIHGTTSWVSPLVTVVFVIYWVYFVDFRRLE